MHVRCSTTTTTPFLVINGVKQGGILSSMLVNVYMEYLSIKLNQSGIGGHLKSWRSENHTPHYYWLNQSK